MVSPALENKTAVLEKAAATTTPPRRRPGRGITPSAFAVTVRIFFATFTSCMLHMFQYPFAWCKRKGGNKIDYRLRNTIGSIHNIYLSSRNDNMALAMISTPFSISGSYEMWVRGLGLGKDERGLLPWLR